MAAWKLQVSGRVHETGRLGRMPSNANQYGNRERRVLHVKRQTRFENDQGPLQRWVQRVDEQQISSSNSVGRICRNNENGRNERWRERGKDGEMREGGRKKRRVGTKERRKKKEEEEKERM